jgi:hypothetical protein
MLGLPLICRSSHRGVVEFMRDLPGVTISVGRAASRGEQPRAGHLSGIRAGLHDELFLGATPVLASVDAQSTYCYLALPFLLRVQATPATLAAPAFSHSLSCSGRL